MKNELKRYYKEIRKKLNCGFHMKKFIMRKLKNDIKEYIESADNVTMSDIYQRFGKPNEILKNFDENELIQIKKKAKLLLIINIMLIIIIVFLIILIPLLYNGLGDRIDITNQKELKYEKINYCFFNYYFWLIFIGK